MPRAGFEVWLARRYPDGPATVRARFSNVSRIESAYGSLDDHYRRDRCAAILASLVYTSADRARRAPNPSRIAIEGDVQNGLSTLRNALKLYVGYLDETAGRPSNLRRRYRPDRAPQSELPLAPGEAISGEPDLSAIEPASHQMAPHELLRKSNDRKGILALLQRYASIEDELRKLGVVRTANVLGDYAEWLCCQAFGWTLAANSEGFFDATDHNGRRIQIKARRISARNPSRQLSALRKLNEDSFDLLAGLLFQSDFTLGRAALIPRDVVAEQSAYVRHVNAWRFMLSDAVFKVPGVVDITEPLRGAQREGSAPSL